MPHLSTAYYGPSRVLGFSQRMTSAALLSLLSQSPYEVTCLVRFARSPYLLGSSGGGRRGDIYFRVYRRAKRQLIMLMGWNGSTISLSIPRPVQYLMRRWRRA